MVLHEAERADGAPLKQRAITLQVMRQPGSNTIEVTDAVRALLPTFESQLPPSVHLTPRQDRSRTIREAFKDIQITMLVTLVLVVGVIFLFPAQRLGDAHPRRSRCPSRSSARSPSCRCCTSASTTCR